MTTDKLCAAAKLTVAGELDEIDLPLFNGFHQQANLFPFLLGLSGLLFSIWSLVLVTILQIAGIKDEVVDIGCQGLVNSINHVLEGCARWHLLSFCKAIWEIQLVISFQALRKTDCAKMMTNKNSSSILPASKAKSLCLTCQGGEDVQRLQQKNSTGTCAALNGLIRLSVTISSQHGT